MSEREWKFVQYDTELSALDEPKAAVETSEAIVDALRQKGFCVLSAKARLEALGEGADLHRDADREVKLLEESGRFERPAEQLLPGLLGEEGSTALCQLDDEGEDGDSLRTVSRVLDTVSALLSPVSEAELGLAFGGRTAGLLHIAGESEGDEEEEPPKLQEAEADKWLSLFHNGRYMLLLCLGPGKGHLELQPFKHEDAPLYVVSTEPGTVVIVRCDTLTQRFYSYERSVVLTSWLAQTSLHEQRLDAGAHDELLNPAARDLLSWINERMRVLKERETFGPEGPQYDTEDLPREWQSAMNHTFVKGAPCSLRGMACKVAASWDPASIVAPLVNGADMASEIPMLRWKYEDHYLPDPNAWKLFKSYTKHGIFMEGAELFDPKPFGLAVYEAKGMDVCQRHILETSYEALIDASFSKKQLMRSLIGVYIGAATTEFQYAENCNEGVGTSCAGAITSNRISFCLGLQGPSYTTDLGAASGLASVSMAVNSIRFQTDLYKANHTAVPGAVSLLLAPQFYVLQCAAGFLSQEGRSCSFDVSAAGYVRGEGVAAAVVTPFAQVLDGVPVRDDSRPWHGNFASVYVNHVGQTASLTAPSGPRETELVNELVRQASLSPLDVDFSECWGESGILNDAVAVKAVYNGLRGDADDEQAPVLGLSSVLSGFGFMHECTGMVQLLKVVAGAKYNIQVPGIHIVELNPHIDAWEGEPLNFHTEVVPFKHVSSFSDLGSKSSSGTLAHVLMWGEVDYKKCMPRTRRKGDAIAFWPAGGGELPEGAEPRKTYYIAGSWASSEWTEPQQMQLEGDGVFGYTLTLGANNFEHFQIWLDGDDQRTLHPGMVDAPKNMAVQGPVASEEAAGSAWLIGGDTRMVTAIPLAGAITDTGEEGALVPSSDTQLAAPATSCPGDKYRVRLHVAGKWRTVDWKLLEKAESGAVDDDGKYYVAGSWSGWSLTPMRAEGDGLHVLEFPLPAFAGDFQIVRNRDWHQVFHPETGEEGVEGPDAGTEGACWRIHGRLREGMRIEFRRSWKEGREERSLCWKRAAE